jgi:two-component sensor histidine kinase
METHQDARIRELEAALERKSTLLREIDHRVKNDLQLISSLILLQSRRVEDEAARHALKTILGRVSAVATVHRRLFLGEDSQRFDVAACIRDLAGDLALAAGRNDVRITLDLDPVTIPAPAAAPLALVANELLGNALKHAFPPGRGGVIAIGLTEAEGACVLTISDDGQGMGEAKKAFGLTIVGLLCQQLRAGLEVASDGPGVRAVVRAPMRLA